MVVMLKSCDHIVVIEVVMNCVSRVARHNFTVKNTVFWSKNTI